MSLPSRCIRQMLLSIRHYLRLTPLCFTPLCFTPLCFTPLCCTSLCFTPLCRHQSQQSGTRANIYDPPVPLKVRPGSQQNTVSCHPESSHFLPDCKLFEGEVTVCH